MIADKKSAFHLGRRSQFFMICFGVWHYPKQSFWPKAKLRQASKTPNTSLSTDNSLQNLLQIVQTWVLKPETMK